MGAHGPLSGLPSLAARPHQDRIPIPGPLAGPPPPLEPSGDTLPAINTHFWDWIWWLTTKASIGRSDLVAEHMPRLYTQLLRPMGISAVPATIESAVEAFVARRNALEQKFGISVDRALETEVRQGIARVLDPR